MADERTVAAAQTARVLGLVREVLGRDALGAYQHGSAVLGGVRPTSDIDILVITGRPATLAEKRRLVDGLLSISAPFPPPGPGVLRRGDGGGAGAGASLAVPAKP